MTKQGVASAYETYLACQLELAKKGAHQAGGPRRFVTISRQAGAGGITVGEKLAAFLTRNEKACRCPWTVFDKNLVERIMEDHDFPESFLPYLKEDKKSEIEDLIKGMLGLPPDLALVRQSGESIARLCQMGNTIVVGRAANVISQKLEGGLHVRLVGSLEKRLRHLQDYYGFDKKHAREFLEEEDRGRANYLKKYFNRDIDNPLLYDLVVNTDEFGYDEAAELIGRAVLRNSS